MPDSKLSALVELAAAPAGTDELYIRDVSEIAQDQSKRITVANLFTGPDINAGTVDSLTSLSIRSTGAAFDLTLATSSVFTAGRTLTINPGDAARTLTISGNATISQDYSTTGSPQFANLVITSGGDIRPDVDAVRAIEFKTADGTGDVLILDTTNQHVAVGAAPASDAFLYVQATENATSTLFRLTNASTGASAASRCWLRTDGGSDPMYLLSLGSSLFYSIGIDNSDGDKLKIENSSFPSTGITVARITLTTTGEAGIATPSPDRRLHVEEETALTATVRPLLRLTHVTSGTPAANIGVGMEFEQETAAGNNEVVATIEAVVTDVTAGSEDAKLVWKLMAGGAAASNKMELYNAPWLILDEADADPTTSELDSLDSGAVYFKNDKLVFAYNNGGTITYISIPLDGSTTTWTHSTTTP